MAVLTSFRDDSSTGPDLLPARILERCAEQLAKPLQSLVQLLLDQTSLRAPNVEEHEMHWPTSRCQGSLRSNRRKKVAVYCSHVSGAFDRVRAERLLEKLRCKGVHPTMVALTESWLQQRTAHVVVEGHFSDKMVLKNMVFQGTVLGPSLWNLFHEDARRAIQETGFEEIVYADDLNGFKEFERNTSVVSVLADAKKCQTELLEYRTPAVYHAAKTTLAGIDAVQRRFLRECGLSDEEALLHFNLAPLETRRDIAVLGLIHRSVLGGGPRHFANMFLPSPPSASQKHDKQLLTHRSPRHLQILSRSALGLVDVYNLLPAQVVGQKSVASMQHELQALLNFRVRNGDSYWHHTFSPRVPLHEHPLLQFS